MAKHTVAFDTETRGLNWWEPDEQAFLGSRAHADEEWADVFSRKRETNRFKADLGKAEIIVAHNLSFDTHQTRATLGLDILELDAELHDTDLMSRILHPEGQRKDRGGHGLKNLAEVYLRADAKAAEEAIKEMGKRIGLRTLKKKGAYYEVWRAFPDVMEEYARADARYTYDLYLKFREKLEAQPKLWELYQLELDVARVLIRAEQRGTALDPKATERLRVEYSKRAEELEAQLNEERGEAVMQAEKEDGEPWSSAEDTDPKVGEALRAALLEIGVPLHRRTGKTKVLATNKFALQEFEDAYPVIGRLFEWRRARKFLSTYIEPMAGRTVVHPSFKQAEAWTGRMSCMRPNMQNLPKRADAEQNGSQDKLRAMIVPRPGHVLIVSDYESIEVRLLAYYLGPQGESYRQLIRDGHDPHAHMAAKIHGGQREDYVKGTPGQPKRDVAKHTMFAITYGAGAPRVSDMNKITKGQAKQLIATIKQGLPGYFKLMKRIRGKIEDTGHVNTLFGRKQVVSPDKSYVGLNSLIQGSAADIMKRGLVLAQRALEPLGGQVILVVHDELVSEVPEEHADTALEAQRAAMVAAYDLDPALEVEGSVVRTNYADA